MKGKHKRKAMHLLIPLEPFWIYAWNAMRTSFGKGLIDATVALVEVAIFKVEY
jgi:hypothetical protein